MEILLCGKLVTCKIDTLDFDVIHNTNRLHFLILLIIFLLFMLPQGNYKILHKTVKAKKYIL